MFIIIQIFLLPSLLITAPPEFEYRRHPVPIDAVSQEEMMEELGQVFSTCNPQAEGRAGVYLVGG